MTMNMLYGDYGVWVFPILIAVGLVLMVSGFNADLNRAARNGHQPSAWCARCDDECRAPVDTTAHGFRTTFGSGLFLLIAPLYFLGLLLIALT
ncbi:hypothetical protein [Nocardioides sp. B-3]|uniref:hypothetical protein n=1 Tax=Nocardioides sp. B-3 TaxID=2895565 RepID=UPI0021531FB5|nr:hypothetical protein [Nocardioides sp. B-3]UUZ60559.1 hypothetical protein LP418_06740 [Nocardioides sp. B-3]